jgi:hypothetical protein
MEEDNIDRKRFMLKKQGNEVVRLLFLNVPVFPMLSAVSGKAKQKLVQRLLWCDGVLA